MKTQLNIKQGIYSLELGLALCLLKHRLHLGRLHDIPADLQLAAHEQPLRVRLAGDQVLEVFVGEVQRDYLSSVPFTT